MKRAIIFISILLVLAGGIAYRYLPRSGGKAGEDARKVTTNEAGKPDAPEKQAEPTTVTLTPDRQKQNGVVVAVARQELLGGVLSATGKVEANADRIAHVSPRISGKIVGVNASLGDSVSAGQALATLDSVELGEALNRYHQSKTKLSLAQSNMERVKNLVEKKIAARKDILQADTDFKTAQSELHTDEGRLSLYGVSDSELRGESHKKPLLPVRSPIGGIITEKHAIVGELAAPSLSLYTVADLSSVWVLVDINEKDLAKVHKGQAATVTVGAFPDLKLKGRITYIADLVNEATRTVKARVEVVNPGRKLKPEMFAAIELALPADAAPVLVVPEDALQDLDGKKILFVTVNGTVFQPRPLELGRASGGKVEVTAGLKQGDRYVVKGGFLLKSELKKSELGE